MKITATIGIHQLNPLFVFIWLSPGWFEVRVVVDFTTCDMVLYHGGGFDDIQIAS